jgi:hypothetical protein
VHATAVSLVLIGHMWTTCKPKPYSSPPSLPPICLQSLTRDIKRAGVGRGRSRCWSSPVSCAPTKFSHGSDSSNMPAPSVLFNGSPFSGENTPVGASEPKMSLPDDNNGAWGEGRGLPRRGDEAWWGGGENTCVMFEIPPL